MASIARKPRFRVLWQDQVLPAVSVELESVGTYQADIFHVEVATGGNSVFGPPFWGENSELPIEIQFGFAEASEHDISWVPLFVGEVEQVTVSLDGGTATIQGRDLTHRLIDANTQETFLNQTASQVATTLAVRHGLTPVVTATTALVNRYYSDDHDHITLGSFHKTTKEWDLLTFLAQRENFDLFVQGTELHFQPRAVVGKDEPFRIDYDLATPQRSDVVTGLQLTRSLTLAKDIIVQVHSWHSGRAQSFTKTARLAAGGKGSKTGDGAPQTFVYVFPNLTPADAQARANAILADLSKHERTIQFDMPGDTDLTPRTLVALTGTETSWDQTYFIESVRRNVSAAQGFTMHVRAKNHSPQSQVQVT